MFTLLDVRSFSKIPQIVCKIGMSRRSIFHAVKSSQMPYTAKDKKINNSTNELKSPSECRLAARRRAHVQCNERADVLASEHTLMLQLHHHYDDPVQCAPEAIDLGVDQ